MGFRKKTLDGIVKGFQKTVDDLEAFVQERTEEIDKGELQIHDIASHNQTLEQEKRHASRIRDNLKNLIEDQ